MKNTSAISHSKCHTFECRHCHLTKLITRRNVSGSKWLTMSALLYRPFNKSSQLFIIVLLLPLDYNHLTQGMIKRKLFTGNTWMIFVCTFFSHFGISEIVDGVLF